MSKRQCRLEIGQRKCIEKTNRWRRRRCAAAIANHAEGVVVVRTNGALGEKRTLPLGQMLGVERRNRHPDNGASARRKRMVECKRQIGIVRSDVSLVEQIPETAIDNEKRGCEPRATFKVRQVSPLESIADTMLGNISESNETTSIVGQLQHDVIEHTLSVLVHEIEAAAESVERGEIKD